MYLHISALAGTGEHRVYPIAYNRALANSLIGLGNSFWMRVQNREVVGTDWAHPFRDDIARNLETIRPDTAVELTLDAQFILDDIQQLERGGSGHPMARTMP